MQKLEEQAIQAALAGQWQRAITINEEILTIDPENIDAMSRLAYAHSQAGAYKKACTIYEVILSKEPYNPIAQKNLMRCRQYDKNDVSPTAFGHKPNIHPRLFVADAQKTRIVQLVNIAPQSVLRMISVGESVVPIRKGFEMHIRTETDTYLGTLPDDVGRKLMMLIKQNESCECFIKDLEDNQLTIFIKWRE